jgi:hypothetical protein
MDKRLDPRFPFTMKAYPLGAPSGKGFETTDLSAGGAYFRGDPDEPVGTMLWVRLELVVVQGVRESIFPLDAEIEVVRLGEGEDGTIQGFGARWLSVSCGGDMTPLQEFLKRVLSISAGFVQALRPLGAERGDPSYVFVFPRAGSVCEGPAAPPPDAADPLSADEGAPETPGAEPAPADDAQLQKMTRTGLYVMLPLTFEADGVRQDGRAVKLLPHSLRIASEGPMPGSYRRVTLRIPCHRKDRAETLTLVGLVTSQRKGTGEQQFEVELSLGNPPDAVVAYKGLLDQIAKTLSRQKP